MTKIAIIAPGAMGSAVGRRVSEHGARVLTSLTGRSIETIRRAEATGMIGCDDDAIAGADVILSVLPPADALALAKRFASPLSRVARKAVFVDCNAVNVETVHQIALIIGSAGARFVDGGIIGPPPGPQGEPTFYFSGADAPTLGALGDLGLKVRIMEGPVGAASALKMSYAGINKGGILLVAAMLLGATRAGVADALRGELAESQPQLLSRIARAIPDMYPKAYRWAPEMEQIADFLGDDLAARDIFKGMAALCRQLAADQGGNRTEIGLLDSFVTKLSRTD
jgi:3-hydroxyisobutyrate dehydrogenase-like beta-hydroxyacid dehydrogenase